MSRRYHVWNWIFQIQVTQTEVFTKRSRLILTIIVDWYYRLKVVICRDVAKW